MFCFLVHHYIPELEIKKSIGTLNNCVLRNIKYYSHNRKCFIKELHIKMHIEFFRNLCICVDKILFKQCHIYISHLNVVQNGDKKISLDAILIPFFKVPICFSNIQFNDLSFSTQNILFFVDHFSSKCYWTGITLKCLYNKIETICIKHKNIIKNNTNERKIVNINKIAVFKKLLNDVLNYLKKFSVNVPIDLDIGSFYSKNIYFCGDKNFNISQFFFSLKIVNNKMSVRKIHFCGYGFIINMYGTVNFNRNFLTNIIINCVNFNRFTKNENINVIIIGFLLKNLEINCHCFGLINTTVRIRVQFKQYSSMFSLNLFIPFLSLIKNNNNYFILHKTKVRIVGKSSNYSFFFNSIVNMHIFGSIQLCFFGIGNYSTIFFKNTYLNIMNKNTMFNIFFGLKNILNQLN
ncbi:MAG: hypothetical protein U0T57_00380 [Buchnera aphidicola (Kaburagia rhusicola rhusicola)]